MRKKKKNKVNILEKKEESSAINRLSFLLKFDINRLCIREMLSIFYAISVKTCATILNKIVANNKNHTTIIAVMAVQRLQNGT